MEKKKTPGISVVMYIIGIIFIVIAAFMLYTAIEYTRVYLQSYDASFASMWSNTLQYIITQTAPYLGIGIVSLGIGKAIKEARAAAAAKAEVAAVAPAPAEAPAINLPDNSALEGKVQDLATEVAAVREILSIKIEEKEKRDSYRINELSKKLEGVILTGEPMAEPPVKLEEEVPAVAEPTVAASAEIKPVPPTPQIFRVCRNMAMADIPRQKKRPQIFTVSRRMAMAEIPRQKKRPQIFTVSRRMAMTDIPS